MNASTTAETTPEARLRQLADLPRPRGLPFLGNLLQLDLPRFHLQLEQWARELGPYYCLQFRGTKILIISDHQAVAAVLRDRPDGFRRPLRLE